MHNSLLVIKETQRQPSCFRCYDELSFLSLRCWDIFVILRSILRVMIRHVIVFPIRRCGNLVIREIGLCLCSLRTTCKKMATVLLGGRKLTDLRVVDLRQELEKRGLEKSGVKAVLIERLQKVNSRYISINFSNRHVDFGMQIAGN